MLEYHNITQKLILQVLLWTPYSYFVLRTAHWGFVQPQLSGVSIWYDFFESLKHAKISYVGIEF